MKIQFRGESLDASVSQDGLYFFTRRGTFLRAEVVIEPEPEPEPEPKPKRSRSKSGESE